MSTYQENTRRRKMCKVLGCPDPGRSRGWCNKHYTRWRIHGDPLKVLKYRDIQEAFESYSLPEPNSGCLLWTGSVNWKGYGQLSFKEKAIQAHRWAWEQVNGPIPEGFLIDHTCYTPSCVNEEHLRLATHSQNGANLSNLQKNNTSGVRNVTWNKRLEKWAVQVQKDGKNHFFGYFSDKSEAAKVAEEARNTLHLEFSGRG